MNFVTLLFSEVLYTLKMIVFTCKLLGRGKRHTYSLCVILERREWCRFEKKDWYEGLNGMVITLSYCGFFHKLFCYHNFANLLSQLISWIIFTSDFVCVGKSGCHGCHMLSHIYMLKCTEVRSLEYSIWVDWGAKYRVVKTHTVMVVRHLGWWLMHKKEHMCIYPQLCYCWHCVLFTVYTCNSAKVCLLLGPDRDEKHALAERWRTPKRL